MRIVVIGNCQAEAMRPCMAFLADAEAEYLTHQAAADVFAQGRGALRSELVRFDAVFVHPFASNFSGAVAPEDMRAAHARSFQIPVVDFPAFHPDITYAFDRQGGLLRGPMGHYNSNLVLYAFLAGLDPVDAVSLFNKDVYRLAGYFDGWSYCQTVLFKRARDIDFPIESMFASWTRRGNFMHTINHPKLFVIEDIARAALNRSGIACRTEACVDYVNDGLAYSVWPVYPEIGSQFGAAGGYTFRRQPHMAALHAGAGQYLDLEGFVSESYASYSALEPGTIVAPGRVAQWLSDSRLARFHGPAKARPSAGTVAAPLPTPATPNEPPAREEQRPHPGQGSDGRPSVRAWIGNRVRSLIR